MADCAARPSAVGSDADADAVVGKALRRIQQFVFQRRIRTKEFFVDFDGHHEGACSVAQFQRALGLMGLILPPDELDALAGAYRVLGAPPMVELNYEVFCADVDHAFTKSDEDFTETISLGSARAATAPRLSQLMGIEGPEKVQGLLERLRVLCDTRGIVFKACFGQIGLSPRPSTTRLQPRQGGKVSKNHFIRLFPVHDRFSPEEVELLAEAFTTETGDVSYKILHEAIASGSDGPHGRGWGQLGATPRLSQVEWSHSRLDPMDKVRAKVVERRVRLYERFQDFDPLRKGVCTKSQFKTICSILDLNKGLTREDIELVAARFSRDGGHFDGMFDYRTFCTEADRDFTNPGLEKDPLATVHPMDMPSPAGLAARRNRSVIASSQQASDIQILLTKIATKVQRNRIQVLPAFQDMDLRCRRGHVTVSQFARVLVQLNLGISDKEVELLRSHFCDMGNLTDFNYIDFAQLVDPPDANMLADQARRVLSPRSTHGETKYFTAFGNVRPLDRAAAVS